MLDPTRGNNNDKHATIGQTGRSMWYLAGTNDFFAKETTITEFTLNADQLYFFGQGKPSKSGAMGENGNIVKAIAKTDVLRNNLP